LNAIEIKNLTKSFGSYKAVDNISLNVPENKVFGFLGPNGAGKTTTIRMVVGLSKPNKGEIKIVDKDVVFGQITSNAYFGYLPEQPSFYNWMTGGEYLNFVANLFNIDENKKKERIDELFKLVDLKEAKKKKIGAYSNGMKQRLGIAQALINEPKVLIMDEPVSALDPIGRREILAIIEKLKEKTTIFMSTHILSDVDRICDEIAIINKGKIIAVSPLAELKAKYATQILEIEFIKDPETIVKELKEKNWVEKIEKNGNQIKIWPKNTKIVEENIPLEFLLSKKIGILKYGLVLPEMEDLFMEILKEDK
jgi:ABC-2 type transport system ATP-binding protein